jgi:hypothetical protein
MKNKLNRFLFTSLFGVTLLAGCAATDIEVRTEDRSSSAQGRDPVDSESKSESRRSKSLGPTYPPNFTYRPGGERTLMTSELSQLINLKQ